MALPTSRNTTYSPASPIESSDINALQDCVIGDKHPDRRLVYSFATGAVVSGGATVTINSQGDVARASGSPIIKVAVVLPSGTRIRQIVYTYDRGGAGNVVFQLNRRTGDGLGANFEILTNSVIAAGTGFTTESQLAINHVTAAGWMYFLEGTMDSAGNVIAFADLTCDRL